MRPPSAKSLPLKKRKKKRDPEKLPSSLPITHQQKEVDKKKKKKAQTIATATARDPSNTTLLTRHSIHNNLVTAMVDDSFCPLPAELAMTKTRYPVGCRVLFVESRKSPLKMAGNDNKIRGIRSGTVVQVGFDSTGEFCYQVRVTNQQSKQHCQQTEVALLVPSGNVLFAPRTPVWVSLGQSRNDNSSKGKGRVIGCFHSEGEDDILTGIRYTVLVANKTGRPTLHSNILPRQLLFRGTLEGQASTIGSPQNQNQEQQQDLCSTKGDVMQADPLPLATPVPYRHESVPSLENRVQPEQHKKKEYGNYAALAGAGSNELHSSPCQPSPIKEEVQSVVHSVQTNSREYARQSRQHTPAPVVAEGTDPHITEEALDSMPSCRGHSNVGSSVPIQTSRQSVTLSTTLGQQAQYNIEAHNAVLEEDLGEGGDEARESLVLAAAARPSSTTASKKPRQFEAASKGIPLRQLLQAFSYPPNPSSSGSSINPRAKQKKGKEVHNHLPNPFSRIVRGDEHNFTRLKLRVERGEIAQLPKDFCLQYHLCGHCHDHCSNAISHCRLSQVEANHVEKSLLPAMSPDGPIKSVGNKRSTPRIRPVLNCQENMFLKLRRSKRHFFKRVVKYTSGLSQKGEFPLDYPKGLCFHYHLQGNCRRGIFCRHHFSHRDLTPEEARNLEKVLLPITSPSGLILIEEQTPAAAPQINALPGRKRPSPDETIEQTTKKPKRVSWASTD
ncbi:expressed unknown protein [Seminavis robusta]|uniref:C3H1-type domain-containing protein n=1 Tax=Seminavis robusta TaxID=568900 RepID=A0A9N8HI02_9STRA|nr:expressed unknown protein [Seminavis robusta]|eukprot:Sro594_g172410.1 n/a (726) ;mRNA; r:13065-15344